MVINACIFKLLLILNNFLDKIKRVNNEANAKSYINIDK
jgi:hypothetical protein